MNTPSSDDILDTIATLRRAVGSAHTGLPDDVFLFISSLTPMVNVDLLVRDGSGRVLLTWREDAFYGPGWHIPGGIIRFKEQTADRIAAVARSELSATVTFDKTPLCVHEMFNHTRDIRGHFISLLYACWLTAPLDELHRFQPDQPRAGGWAWHAACPPNLIPPHHVYRRWFAQTTPPHDPAMGEDSAAPLGLSCLDPSGMGMTSMLLR